MIYLIRHGLDDERFIGGYSNVDLTDLGKENINEVGIWLNKQNFVVNRIYTSDIKRAISTANIINRYLELPIIQLIGLRELDKGELTGMDKKIAYLKYPNYIKLQDINIRYPNGESMLDLYTRIKILLKDISQYDNSIMITHRGVINMIYYILNDIQLDMDKEKFNVTHGSIHELDLKQKKIRKIL